MTDPFSWPGLRTAGGRDGLPERLIYERAVWGKLHGSASDYRWIAASSGFDPERERLEEEIAAGPEDEVRLDFPLWRTLPSGHLAVRCSPGRSVDASGRRSSLVKQVLHWRRPEGMPAALGALLLLPHTGKFDDSLWLGSDPGAGAAEELDPEHETPVQVSVAEIASAAEQGIEDLRRKVAPSSLAELYAGLLAGVRPALLPTIGEPLSPAALAALLLPLGPDLGAEISLAGWVSSSRARREHLEPRWDGVAVSPELVGGLGAAESNRPLAKHRERGRRLAEALLTARPSMLGSAASGAAGSARTGAGDEAHPIQLAMWGPSAAGKTILLARLASTAWADAGPWQVSPTADLLAYSRSMRQRIDGENRFPPPTGVQPERLAYRFERKSDGLRAVLSLEDRRGSDWEKLEDEVRRSLETADGLLLMVDPLRDPAQRDIEIRDTLDLLAVSRQGRRDERPLAVCLTKADTLVETPADLRLARDDPQRFVQRRLSAEILAILDQYHAEYRLYPVSAVGVRLRWGVVEPAIFYDEMLQPRIHPGAEPIHLVSPFAWLLDRAAERRGESAP